MSGKSAARSSRNSLESPSHRLDAHQGRGRACRSGGRDERAGHPGWSRQELEGFLYLAALRFPRAFDPLAVRRFYCGPFGRSFAHHLAVFVRNASAIGALPEQNLIPPCALEALSFNLRYHRRSLSPHDDKKIAVSPSHIGAGQPDARNARHDFVKFRGHAMVAKANTLQKIHFGLLMAPICRRSDARSLWRRSLRSRSSQPTKTTSKKVPGHPTFPPCFFEDFGPALQILYWYFD